MVDIITIKIIFNFFCYNICNNIFFPYLYINNNNVGC